MTTFKRGDSFPDIYAGGKKDVSLKFRDQMDSAESITAAVWTSTPAGLSLTGPSEAGRVAGVTISGGTAGQTYVVMCDVTTDGGQIIHAEKNVSILATAG